MVARVAADGTESIRTDLGSGVRMTPAICFWIQQSFILQQQKKCIRLILPPILIATSLLRKYHNVKMSKLCF
jgi:hypothetical protein